MLKRLLFISLWLSSAVAWGQTAPPPLQIGLGWAGYSYSGDLTYGEDRFRRAYPGGAISVQFAGARVLHLQLNAGFGRFIEQSDGWTPTSEAGIRPNSFVETSLFYTDLRLRFRPWHRRVVHPYFSVGLGMLSFSPRDQEGNSLAENTLTRQAGEIYGSTTAAFPLNAGLMVRLNPQASLGAGYTYRLTASDYLDNIGQLGRAPGNDRLHSLDLTLYVQFQGMPVPVPPTPEPPTVPLIARPQPAPEGLFIPDNDATWIELWAWPAPGQPEEAAVERIGYRPPE